MTNRTNFFIKLITSIYDIKVFSKYAKEGILRSISYAVLLSFLLGGLKSAFVQYRTYNLDIISFVDQMVAYFSIILFNLLFNCLIASIVAALFTVFLRMVVKYIALYSLTLYAATLPLIIQIILETANPNIRFDTMFIVGTLTYVILILKYIKDEIIRNYT
ncbi:DUF1189 family protein [Clostridium beijerinckii]|uniref:DUF1189 domain-containing protein n=1 Tax=Clostridium beijerinckii TaxID=1520 RepID=A0AAX0B5X3_CLOBE|nr:DUF1189 family protein [Clostridium beijerinckii]NRT90541.1 hypothetical protein [Clostridium beijerinckii]NYC70066.1 hypothetical protein [Clostridium beijerinckii]